MKGFKFLRRPIAVAHDGGYIYPGDVFYTMNKEDIRKNGLKIWDIPKYSIVKRKIDKKHVKFFKPDYELLWYFRSFHNAKSLKNIWRQQDRYKQLVGGGESMFYESSLTIQVGG